MTPRAAWCAPLLLALLLVPPADASHLRGGTLEWRTTEDPLEVRFDGTLFTRASYYANADVGSDLAGGELTTQSPFHSASFTWRVYYVNEADDWLAARMTATGGLPTIEFPAPTYGSQPWKVTYTANARLGAGHINNPDQAMNLRADIVLDPEAPTRSPTAFMPPFVNCLVEETCRAPVITNGEDLRFSLAYGAEAGGDAPPDLAGLEAILGTVGFHPPGPPEAPHAARVDPVTGWLEWDTRGARLAPEGPTYYSIQVGVHDGPNKIPLDFFLRLLDRLPEPPRWVAPSPCGGEVTAPHKGTVRFQVAAQSVVGAAVTVDALALPPEAEVTREGVNPARMTVSFPAEPHADRQFIFLAHDAEGGQAEPCAVTVRMAVNQVPVASFTAEGSPHLGDTWTFTDTSTDDGVLRWLWDVDDDGAPDGTGKVLEHVFDRLGSHTVRLRVTDEHGLWDVTTQVAVVDNVPPVAAFQVPTTAGYGEEVRPEDASSDDGTIASWRWEMGDGTVYEVPDPVHVYDARRSYRVCLTVTDDRDATDRACHKLAVLNRVPTVTIRTTPPDLSATGHPFGFSCETSDPDGDPVRCAWDLGGTTAVGASVGHAFDRTGTHLVSVRADDRHGGVAVASTEVTVDNESPRARFVVDRLLDRDGLRLRSVAADRDGAVVEHSWDLGDGTTFTGTELVHEFPDPERTYQVRLEVTDDGGARDAFTRFIRSADVAPPAPVPDEEEPPPVLPGPDRDDDGIDDDEERLLGLDPDAADSDGDGRPDRRELLDGTSPLDGTDPDPTPDGFRLVRTDDAVLAVWSADDDRITGFTLLVDGERRTVPAGGPTYTVALPTDATWARLETHADGGSPRVLDAELEPVQPEAAPMPVAWVGGAALAVPLVTGAAAWLVRRR